MNVEIFFIGFLFYIYASLFMVLVLAYDMDKNVKHPVAVCFIMWPIILLFSVLKKLFSFLNWIIDILTDCGKLTIKLFLDIVR